MTSAAAGTAARSAMQWEPPPLAGGADGPRALAPLLAVALDAASTAPGHGS